MAADAPTSPRRSPWPKDRGAEREEKREALLHAAARAFADAGFHRTSLDDIAERLGVTKPTLYYYARSKEELIAAVASRALDQMMAPIAVDPDAPALAALRAFLRRYAEVVANDFGRCFALLSAFDLTALTGERVRDAKRQVDRRLRELIAAGIADGSVARCDVRLTGFMLGGAINGIARWYRDDGAMDPAAVADAFVAQLTDGLAPRP